jgi:ferritin-like protein
VDRRRFVIGALGAGSAAIATPWLGSAAAATEDDFAFANFGATTELLVKDFYSKALEAKLVKGSKLAALRRGRPAAGQHAKALSDLLTNAGDVAPLPEDFEFEWPANTFKTDKAIVETGRGVLKALLGAYQTAAASASDASYRVLYASLAASVSQQLVALAGPVAAEPFPNAMDLEAASDALEAYLG